MGRRPRIYIPGVSDHVIQRGHNLIAIFDEAADYEHFLALVRNAASRHSVHVHGFVLMTTHYHLIVTPQSQGGLPSAMKEIDGGYVRHYNRKHGRLGTLWCSRYRALPILEERYWLTCLRYIERNPVEAGMVAAAESYRWSSYRVHALGASHDWLAPHHLYEKLGSTPADRQAVYRAFCAGAEVSDTVAELPRCLTP
jgi:REP-associated tyrosine transposase